MSRTKTRRSPAPDPVQALRRDAEQEGVLAELTERMEYSRSTLEAKRRIGWFLVRSASGEMDPSAQDDRCLPAAPSLTVA